MAEAPDREFAVFQRGEMRDLILSLYRNALRDSINPDTELTFTEEEIAVATAKGTKKWVEADADDLIGMIEQQRALWLADQIRVDRAGSSWLVEYHGRMWNERPLPATGGSGTCKADAATGTVFVGSTTLPDPAATYATDTAGLRYQVLYTVTTPAGGTAELELAAIDASSQTNLTAGATLTWANAAPGAQPTFTVTGAFNGGTDGETNVEFARRLAARIRHKPAAGNVAHFRAWAREASNAVEDAFVYPCALHAGSVVVCVTSKRQSTSGPIARIPGPALLSSVRAYLTPPASPTVPAQAHVLVVTPVSEQSDVLLSLAMAKGRSSGWADRTPWPTHSTTVSSVTHVTTQLLFRIHSDSALPAGISDPSLMVWNRTTSRFERLNVTSVVPFGGGEYTVTLSQAASFAIAIGDYVSPDTERRDQIAVAVEAYFDTRGPGEVLDLNNDTRAHRAFRFPQPFEEWPQIAGSDIVTMLQDELGVALATANLISMSVTSPSLPTDPILGPSMITLHRLAVYAT